MLGARLVPGRALRCSASPRGVATHGRQTSESIARVRGPMPKSYLVTGCCRIHRRNVTRPAFGGGPSSSWLRRYQSRLRPADESLEAGGARARNGFDFHQLDITNRALVRDFFVRHAAKRSALRRLKPFFIWRRAPAFDPRSRIRGPTWRPTSPARCTCWTRAGLMRCRSSCWPRHRACTAPTVRLPFARMPRSSRPLSPYAASKKAAEALAYSYHALHGLDVSVLRYFTVYGPAGRPT